VKPKPSPLEKLTNYQITMGIYGYIPKNTKTGDSK
jgi:hypothetical protein